MVKTLCFHCWVLGSILGEELRFPQAVCYGQTKQQQKRMLVTSDQELKKIFQVRVGYKICVPIIIYGYCPNGNSLPHKAYLSHL